MSLVVSVDQPAPLSSRVGHLAGWSFERGGFPAGCWRRGGALARSTTTSCWSTTGRLDGRSALRLGKTIFEDGPLIFGIFGFAQSRGTKRDFVFMEALAIGHNCHVCAPG